MSEEAELRAKIAALSGRINQQRQVGSAPPTPTYPPPAGRGSGYYPTGRGAGWAGQYVPDRYAPYHQPRAYPHKPVHRNRTLVVNSSVGAPASQQSSPATPAVTPSSSQWVSKRDRHMQLINTAVYDQKTQQRQLEIEATEQERQRLRDVKEKAKVIKAFQAHSTGSTPYGAASSASTAAVHDIQINNLRFRVAADGSKLIRMFDDSNTDPGATPKSAKVAGVTFHRSKNGNLYRAGLVKKSLRDNNIKKSSELCSMFTSTGMCANGNRCHYTHDPNKTAICKDFLRTGRCVAGEACNLSHESTPHRVPACTHFLRGNCTNPDCRYAHVAVNPSAPVCRAFGTIGYCEKGADCTERHMFECPDYANTGVCRNKKCRLPHVDTAGNLRKAKLAEAKTEEGNTSDLSSDEESYDGIDYDDVDSDNFSDNEVMGGTEERDHELAQQQDYVGFS
ncbi:hypothetical protein M438DRAFT_368786 [Aureobasidium pullulans EXF-150]|uniref:C3H1-type domain-containing protein n=1 Tax=Aureobasidium pullulans EXF-150 TaxID=1043002 RepID=A0A074X422_AURPU|nr:uncharacterized protein M438DRAFT_368786 [Aureobasidium pullulans EXF-150]KEQ80255.1 hypothetical protein M438DRAFT_368786 [Aureobasidium pullulans EXF-150]